MYLFGQYNIAFWLFLAKWVGFAWALPVLMVKKLEIVKQFPDIVSQYAAAMAKEPRLMQVHFEI